MKLLVLLLSIFFSFTPLSHASQMKDPSKIAFSSSLQQPIHQKLQEIAKKYHLAHPKIYLREVKNDFAEVGREHRIFFISDEQNPVFVAKLLHFSHQDEKNDYYVEKNVFRKLSSYPWKYFHIPSLQYASVETVSGESIGILLEEKAPGISVNQWMKKRPSRIEMEIFMKKLALSLAELHRKKPKETFHPSYHKIYAPLAKKIETKPEKILPGPYGLIHGDLHPGNLFYDGETITFIDIATMYNSLDGAPIALDVANFLLLFDSLASYYNLKDQGHLRRVFLKTYQKECPQVTEELINFYETLIALEYQEYLQNTDRSHLQAFHTKHYIDAFLTKRLS